MSEFYEHDANLEKRRLDYLNEIERNTRIIGDKRYTEETTERKIDSENEKWSTKAKSPIAGKLSRSMEELERLQGSEAMNSDEVSECIKDCLDCYQICTQTITKCLTMGGKYAELQYINLLLDCARICNTNADFMLRDSPYYPQTCGIAADICDECEDISDRFDDDFMKECASVCRHCAESCREMAK